MTTQHPEALIPDEKTVMAQAQVYASTWAIVGSRFDAGDGLELAEQEKTILADMVRRLGARITELESQLAQRFDAADMATAAAQGFRDGGASLSANAGEPHNTIYRDALIDAIAQGLHGTWHCTRVWEAWHVGTMSQDDFEPVDESETPTEIADAVLALLAAPPTAQAEGWISVDERLPGEQGPADGESNE